MSAAEEIVPTARILECSEKEYHADPCAAPSLSQSIAHIIVSQSPLHGWMQHPRLGKAANEDGIDDDDDNKDRKQAIINGKIIHKLLLGKGQDIAVVDAKDWRTNAAKAERDGARAAGRIPILTHKYRDLVDASDFIRDRLVEIGYPLNGESEVTFEWTADGERGPVTCRSRMDHVHFDNRLIIDVKKIRSASPLVVSRHIYDYGYDVQDHAYKRCLAQHLGCAFEDVRMVFLFVEEKPPYAITPVELSPAFAEIGRLRWERGLLTWEKCLLTNKWPDYADGKLITIDPQPYVLTKEIGNGEW